MEKLKLAVIGAGSTYTPELVEGIIKRRNELPVTELYLMDIDPLKLEIVGGLARRMMAASGMPARTVLTAELEEAVRGADFIICQIRVGKLAARVRDEQIPLRHDLIGQETTGAGGFMKALRTIPELSRIAGIIERLAPEAWLINFTNPSGIMAEMLLDRHRVKTIGLCNVPINMERDARKRIPPERASGAAVEYVGLNHLSWVTEIYLDGKGILADQLRGNFPTYRPANLPKIDFEPELLRELGAIPSGYLTYYYYRERSLAHLKQEPRTRGEVCREIEAELLQLYRQPDLHEKPALLERRGGHLYSEAAISLVSAIYNDKKEEHVVNVRNQGALPFMEERDVVEIRCVVDGNGARPLPMPHFANEHIIGMMRALKAYERLTVQAGLSGDRGLALQALLNHPLVGDYGKARAVLEEMLAANRAFLPQFFGE